MFKRYRIRRARRDARTLSFDEAAEMFGAMLAFELDVEPDVLAVLADRACATAPSIEQADRYRAYRNALQAGYRVKFGVYPVYTKEGWAT